MNKLKVLLFPLSSFISHVTRCLCIADELRARGHLVEFACSKTNEKLIRKSGYITHIVRQLCHEQIIVTGAPKEYLKKYRKNTFNSECLKKFGLKKMASDDINVLKKVKPHLVICDASPTSYLAATVLEIPCIMVKNILGYIDSNLSKHALTYGIDLSNELDFTLEDQMSEEFKTDCIKLNQAFIEKYKTIPFIIPGVPEFEKINGINIFENLSHCFVGNFDWNGWKKNIKPKKNKYKNKKVILVTMGSSFPFENVVLNILKAFPDDPFHIIINTGGQVNISKIRSDQKNFEVYPYLSLNDFLEISDIIVFHGGHGTTMSALKAGVPSVVIPFNGDQMVISKQIEKFNCGIRIKKYPDDINSIELYKTINKVLSDNRYKDNSIKYGNLVRSKGNGAINAVDFIEDFYSLRKWEDQTSQKFLELVLLRHQKKSKKELKVLFALDNNRSHIVSNCISLAHELSDNGAEIGFIISAKNKLQIERAGFKPFISSSLPSKFLTGINIHKNYFNTFFNGKEYAPTRLKYLLKKMIKDDLDTFYQFQPNIIIDAGRMSLETSCKHLELPSVKFHSFQNSSKNVTNTNNCEQTKLLKAFHHTKEELKQLFPPPPKLKTGNNNSQAVLEPLLTPTIPSLKTQLLNGESNKRSIVYLGNIENNANPSKLKNPGSIYLDTTVISILLNDIHIYKNVLQQILTCYVDSNIQIIVLQEKPIKEFFQNNIASNIQWISKPAIPEFMKISDLLIHNGSYENTLIALKHRIPSLIIPYYEDEFNFSDELIKNNWGISIQEYPDQIKKGTIVKNIDKLLLMKKQMQKNMIQVSGELSIWNNGGKRGAFIIEDFHKQLINLQTN